MKFMCTLRDEQPAQYSNWNKLHVAGHWTFQINCKKQNWFFFSFSFYPYSPGGWRRRGSYSLTRPNSEHQSTAGVSSISLASSKRWYCPLSRGRAHNHRYTISHEGLLVLLGQSRLGPLQCSPLCFARDTNSVTCKTLAKAACPSQSWQLPMPYQTLSCDEIICPWGHPDQRTDVTKVNRQSEWVITHFPTNPEVSRSVRLIQSTYAG